MQFELQNTILNDVLCFLYTSRDSITNEDAINMTVSFYDSEAIKEAKSKIFKICQEKYTARKASKNSPNPSIANVQDILDLFIKMEGKNFLFPSFVAKSFTSMPPPGFTHFARILGSLRDEMTSLKEEIKQLREAREVDLKSLEDVSDVKQDIADIKVTLNSRAPLFQRQVTAPALKKSHVAAVPIQNQVAAVSRQCPETAPLPRPVDPSQSSARISTGEPHQSDLQPTISSGEGNFTYAQAILSRQGPFNSSRQQTSSPPRNRHNHRSKKSMNVKGTSESEEDLSGVPRTLDIFVGGCILDTTVNKVINHCKKRGNLSFVECDILEIRSRRSKAFKVSVLAEDRDKLLVPEFWPIGVYVQKFFDFTRRPSFTNQFDS